MFVGVLVNVILGVIVIVGVGVIVTPILGVDVGLGVIVVVFVGVAVCVGVIVGVAVCVGVEVGVAVCVGVGVGADSFFVLTLNLGWIVDPSNTVFSTITTFSNISKSISNVVSKIPVELPELILTLLGIQIFSLSFVIRIASKQM